MYIGTTIVEIDLELTEEEAVSIIKWKNMKGQRKADILSDLRRIWEEVEGGYLYRCDSRVSLLLCA